MNSLKKLKAIAGERYKQYCIVNEYFCTRLTVHGLIFGQYTLNQCGTVGNNIEKDNKHESNCFTVSP